MSKQKKLMKETASARSHVATSSSKNEKKVPSCNQTLADVEMDIVYAEYLQMIFLESEAKRTLLERSNYVMEIIRKLLYLITKYSKRVNSQIFSWQTNSFLIEVHEVLQEQEDILEPLIKIVPTLRIKYRNLAKAVSILKHKLQIKDIQVPQSGQEGDVINMLKEMQAFISEFYQQLSQYRTIAPTVDAYKVYIDLCEKLKNVFERGLNLVLEAKSLSFNEASLALPTGDSELLLLIE